MHMSRRTLMHSALLVSTATAAQAMANTTDDSAKPTLENLGSTALIETQHPRIIQFAQSITRSATSERNAAVLLHDWVRDEIAFGIPSGFYETTATETLDAKVGYCNTKVTLFQALLRARSIPTRMRMMDLSAQVLQGLFDPGTSYVDHALTEVYLEGRWIAVDSYVVDRSLAAGATKKLLVTQQKAGFGVHINGKTQWNGSSNNFIQYMNDSAIKDYALKDHGLFIDVADFYKRVPEARNRKTVFNSVGIRFGHSYINKQIQKVREQA